MMRCERCRCSDPRDSIYTLDCKGEVCNTSAVSHFIRIFCAPNIVCTASVIFPQCCVISSHHVCHLHFRTLQCQRYLHGLGVYRYLNFSYASSHADRSPSDPVEANVMSSCAYSTCRRVSHFKDNRRLSTSPFPFWIAKQVLQQFCGNLVRRLSYLDSTCTLASSAHYGPRDFAGPRKVEVTRWTECLIQLWW
jgi:hypothetical protein